MKLYGFTLLRNGVKYDYPFEESLKSLIPITEAIYLSLGDSNDGTNDRLHNFPKLKIIPTIWDENLRKGGLILSQQTNVSLDSLREDQKSNPDAWGFYLQSDEVLHEEDYQRILSDIRLAHEQGFDAVRFRFLHFWQHHNQIAINKKWYPSEIRAVKLKSSIESWGDAQSFRNFRNVYDSDATIYHYGHVREKESYQQKKKDILKWYHTDSLLPKYKRRERKLDDQTQCLDFFGPHPKVMKKRIERFGDRWTLPKAEKLILLFQKDGIPIQDSFLKRINVKDLYVEKEANLKKAINFLRNHPSEQIIIWRPNFWQRILFKQKVPPSMKSKLARPWPPELLLILKLSQKKIGLIDSRSD